MTDPFFKNHHLRLVTTLLVAWSLIFAGVRIPDALHPHRPKPTCRAVIESAEKAASFAAKKVADDVAVVQRPGAADGSLAKRSATIIAARPRILPPTLQKKSRSPPLPGRFA